MPIEISIVIPNYNGRRLLEKNLPQVIAACKSWEKERLSAGRQDWEIIVVDDASTDKSVDFIKTNYPRIKLVVHQKNQRFAMACNSGVKEAKGKVVILLNSDVVPEIGFLKPLIFHFNNPQVFAVGCREKDIQNGNVIFSGRAQARFERGFLLHRRAKNQDKSSTYWAAGGSMAVSREKWLKLGGMDTLFRPAYYEDIDLSWRARHLAGWQVLFEPKSVVNHHHETTNLSVFSRQQMKVYAYKNQFLFVWKNGDTKVLIEHLFWLPYHILKAIISGDRLFMKGFKCALRQLPELIKKK